MKPLRFCRLMYDSTAKAWVLSRQANEARRDQSFAIEVYEPG